MKLFKFGALRVRWRGPRVVPAHRGMHSAVERIWHIQDSQGLGSQVKYLKPFSVVPGSGPARVWRVPCSRERPPGGARPPRHVFRCRANMAHVRQSRPDSGLGSQVKDLKPFQVVPSSLVSGNSDTLLPCVVLPQRAGFVPQTQHVNLWIAFEPVQVLLVPCSQGRPPGGARPPRHVFRSRANMTHIRQSSPDSGLGSQVTLLSRPLFARKRTCSSFARSLFAGEAPGRFSLPLHPGSFPLQNRRICTADPACQLMDRIRTCSSFARSLFAGEAPGRCSPPVASSCGLV